MATKRRRSRERQSGSTPAKDMALRYERIGKRLTKYAARLKAYGVHQSILDYAGSAIIQTEKAREALIKLPDSWRPERGSVYGAPLIEGTLVKLRKAFQSQYEGIFPPLATFTVTRVVRGRVICALAESGEKTTVVFPRAHVQA